MSRPFPSGYNRYVYIAAVVCALGGLLFGYDTGIISGALLFIREDLGLSAFLQSAVVSAIVVGAIVAALIFIVRALGSAFAPNVASLSETATLWGYCAVAVGAFAFVYFLMPETKGRSLEEIEADLRGKAGPRKQRR